MTGTVDDPSGALNVAAVDFVFPSFTGMASGIPVKVDFKAVAPISGTMDLATGALTT